MLFVSTSVPLRLWSGLAADHTKFYKHKPVRSIATSMVDNSLIHKSITMLRHVCN
jgi:hypothetical protein